MHFLIWVFLYLNLETGADIKRAFEKDRKQAGQLVDRELSVSGDGVGGGAVLVFFRTNSPGHNLEGNFQSTTVLQKLCPKNNTVFFYCLKTT